MKVKIEEYGHENVSVTRLQIKYSGKIQGTISPLFSPNLSRNGVRLYGCKADEEKHSEAYLQYVENVFQGQRSSHAVLRRCSRSLVRNAG